MGPALLADRQGLGRDGLPNLEGLPAAIAPVIVGGHPGPLQPKGGTHTAPRRHPPIPRIGSIALAGLECQGKGRDGVFNWTCMC